MVGYICHTHIVSVTYKLGVTAAGMIEQASLLEATEGKRPIAAAWLQCALEEAFWSRVRSHQVCTTVVGTVSLSTQHSTGDLPATGHRPPAAGSYGTSSYPAGS
eukprot:COSAG01_NODE_1986_length_8712_cov_118.329618_2_plen_104_part_00